MRYRVLMLTTALMVAAAACGDDGGGEGANDAADAADAASEPAGSDTDDGDDGDESAADGSADDAANDDATTDDGDDGDGATAEEILDDFDFGEGAARIVVGDTTYEFALGGNSTVGSTTYIGVCQELFGLIAGGGYDVNGGAITVEFEIPPPDWESYDDGRFDTSSPKIGIEDEENGTGWVADMQLAESFPEAAGASQIDDWTSDGTRASGNATFIQVEPFGAPVDGAAPVSGTFEIGCE